MLDYSDRALHGARGQPSLPREKTVRTREESKSGGSNNINNDSIGGESGANKDNSKSEGNRNGRRTDIIM